jgi:hypothetical protein
MPALFPFLALSLLLVSKWSAREKPGRFSIPAMILLGMLGGSPAGARLLDAYGSRARLSERAAQCAAACITTASPMFILGTLTAWLGGGSARDGMLMLAAHIAAALLAGAACFAWTRRIEYTADSARSLQPEPTAPQQLRFGEAVSQASLAMLNICGCMILFNVLLECALALIAMPDYAAAALACALEMAGGCARVAALPISRGAMAGAMCAAVTFGGVSVFMQNASYLTKLPVRMTVQFAARVFAGALAYMLCRALMGEWRYAIAAAALFVGGCLFAIPPNAQPDQRPSFSSLRLRRSMSAISMARSSTCLSIASQWSRFIR